MAGLCFFWRDLMTRIAVTANQKDAERFSNIVRLYGRLFKEDEHKAVRWLCVALRGTDTERCLREQILRASKPWAITLVITSYHA